MKLPAAPRRQRSLLKSPQTLKQVRAGEKTSGCVCVYSFLVPPWTLTWVVQIMMTIYRQNWAILWVWSGQCVGSSCWSRHWWTGFFFFPEETEEPTFFGRTIWLSSSCLQSPLWHSFLSESLTGKICVLFNPFYLFLWGKVSFRLWHQADLFTYCFTSLGFRVQLNEQGRHTGTFIIIIKSLKYFIISAWFHKILLSNTLKSSFQLFLKIYLLNEKCLIKL